MAAPVHITIDERIEGSTAFMFIAFVGAKQCTIFFLEQDLLTLRTSFHYTTHITLNSSFP